MSADVTTTIAFIGSFLAIAFAILYWYLTRTYNFFNKLGISGPIPSCPFGTWNRSARKFLGQEDEINSAKFGPLYGTFDGLTPNLLTTDPTIIKTIVTSDSFRDRRATLVSNKAIKRVLQVLSGEDQKDVNTLLSSSVKQNRLSKIIARLESTANALVRGFLKSKEDITVTVNSLVTDFIQDTSALALLGIDLNADPVFRQGYIKHSQRLYSASNVKSPLAVLPQLYGGDDCWIIPKNTLVYFKNIILTAINERSREESSVESKASDFIDILLEAAREEKKLVAKEKAQDKAEPFSEDILLTDEVLTDQVIAALLILNHWTKSAIIFGVNTLATRPDIQEKLQEQVKGMESSSYDLIQSLPYLDTVLMEILRFHPPEFRLEKIVDKDLTIKENLTLKKGTCISVPLFALHKSKDIYQNPAEFRPERFSAEKGEKRPPNTYLPFGQAGDNPSTIGLQFGILAAKLALLKIASKLKIQAIEGEEFELYQTGVTGVPLPGEIRVKAEARD